MIGNQFCLTLLSRQKFSSSGKFEKVVGYSRAVKVGNFIFVSGTTGTDADGKLVSAQDSYAQTKKAIENIESALSKAGASLMHVVRTRVFVRADADWHSVAKAHEESFHSILPASSMLVCSFLDPNILVEIEADAVVD